MCMWHYKCWLQSLEFGPTESVVLMTCRGDDVGCREPVLGVGRMGRGCCMIVVEKAGVGMSGVWGGMWVL